jgi:DNA-binding FadR family transcriptional regulator
MDMTPLWRARGGDGDGELALRRPMAVAAEIRSRIAEGSLREGDRLPPLPELSEEFGISRPTLRETLRILETELLVDLRSGDRAGAAIQMPTTQVAAQLAGIVMEARQATLGDFHRTLAVLEPAIMEIVASRIDAHDLKRLVELDAELGRSVDDTSRFVPTMSEAQRTAFTAARNPALTVIAEILHWVRVGVEPTVTAQASRLPWVARTNRTAHDLFSRFVAAAEDHDAAGAREVWTELVALVGSFFEDAQLRERLVLELTD